MSSSTSDQATSAVVEALQTLYHNPNSAAKKRANEWLEEFQHSVEAWQTCHTLLTTAGSPTDCRLFSAQTLRAKILYDLPQVPREQLPPLRDSIINSLPPLTQSNAPSGSRAVLTQICLALADLALQMPEWTNVVGGMMDQFGKDPLTVNILLGFLKALVEESGNHRVPLSGEEARDRLTELISGAAEQVVGLLTMYLQATGVTIAIQISVFETLRSWLMAGEIQASQVAQTPLFNAAFDALSSDQLFDAAVDVICDLIHETQEVQDNVEVIQQILPRVVGLRPRLEEKQEDPDSIRGYCRIFCEAGECYKDLIARHTAELLPLVEAIGTCAAYPDLDIVPITFNFWWSLASAMGRQPSEESSRPLLDIYANLQTVIIGHLHFSADDEQETAQERDEFRTFRHRMGDTLKDCCHVLGATTCLRKSYDLVVTALSKPSPSWQEIEAPLFSMRSMGAEVDPDDDEVLPHIMSMLPELPDHPRIRYAAILVISRYTQWIDRHPDNLAFQLQYISAGFDMTEESVSAAAAQAMRFMCQDCNQHLVPFLPQLHQFVTSVGNKLDQTDMVEVCEAIGYVISSMPPEQAAPALQQFCEPLIQRLQAATSSQAGLQGSDLQQLSHTLEQIDSYLSVVHPFDPLPESCIHACSAIYAILDALLARNADNYSISERVGSVLRRGLSFFPNRAIQPILPPLMDRMASAFEQSGFASYLWIIGKVATKIGEEVRGPGGQAIAELLGGAFERVTNSLAGILTSKVSLEIPDVMDDYVHCFMAYLKSIPPILSSPTIPLAIQHTLSALTCPSPETILISLDVLTLLSTQLKSGQQQHTQALQPVFNQYGQVIVGLVIGGVVSGFPEDGLDQVQEILSATVGCVDPMVAEGWCGLAVGGLAGHLVPVGERQVFLSELHQHLMNPGTDRLKNALNNLVRAARRARERGRQARKSLGAGME